MVYNKEEVVESTQQTELIVRGRGSRRYIYYQVSASQIVQSIDVVYKLIWPGGGNLLNILTRLEFIIFGNDRCEPQWSIIVSVKRKGKENHASDLTKSWNYLKRLSLTHGWKKKTAVLMRNMRNFSCVVKIINFIHDFRWRKWIARKS